MKNTKPQSSNQQPLNQNILNQIAQRAHYLATRMIFEANHRGEKEKGEPKVGGHISASASALHIMGALHLVVKSGFDFIANKPHASPTDHAYNYLLDLFLRPDFSRFTLEECNTAMMGLRKFSDNKPGSDPVFQSYHSAYDPDNHNFFPTGTVGIPPVQAGYLALAYRYAKEHGYKVPENAHFWSLSGDSEFREGSMYEAIPDFAEREIGNLTWILDYNRQSLDGHRITNKKIMNGTDATRVERTMVANGWEVIQVKHGSKRLDLFKRPGGDLFQKFIEDELEDYEFQALLLVKDMSALKKGLAEEHPKLKKFLSAVSDVELYEALRDLGGHDMIQLAQAMLDSKKNTRKPTMIIAHTLKGWGLKMAASPGNHSALLGELEMDELRKAQGLSENTSFARFENSTEAGKYLKQRSEKLFAEILEQNNLKKSNQEFFSAQIEKMGSIPDSLEVSTKMASYPHTQWMLGQLTAKLIRIANTSTQEKELKTGQKPLNDFEKSWKIPAELMISMAPDVGTSTNLNPAMDGKIFGAPVVAHFEDDLGVKDDKQPDLVPGEEVSDRYLRFEIAECNVMSCMGSFGKLRDILGIPILPLMTVYDFFIKRALDQYFYELYWKSSFILVGTPSGVTLSPEGAQHGWKSDFQIPNQIIWEPFFTIELDWILCDAIKRHVMNTNQGRTGVLIRGVTRGVEQKDLLINLKKQIRYQDQTEEFILENLKHNVLNGAYYLIDYRGYNDYSPGDNVVHIFSMGSLTTEAIKASNELLNQGVYANVIVVTSPDLLCGIQGHQSDYSYLKNDLKIDADLYLKSNSGEHSHALINTLAGQRIPIVSVHDGEAGILDNLGSIIGVRQEALAVRKHSKCGRPDEIYGFHQIDSQSVIQACFKVLTETALEKTIKPL